MNHPRHHARGLAAALAEQLRHQVNYHGLAGLLPQASGPAKAPDIAEPPARVASAKPAKVQAASPPSPAQQPAAKPPTTGATKGGDGSAGPSRSEAAPNKAPPTVEEPPQAAKGQETDDPSRWSASKKLEVLRVKHIGDCQRCLLCRSRRNIVFGVGDAEADLMFVGEAPGADEDAQGEPFVGAAGRRLTEWVECLGLTRNDVYIANVLKCRPPGNRDPAPMEVQKCGPFLRAQIRAIRPKVIVALGRYAGVLLTGKERKLYELRGASHGYQDPRAPGYSPALMVTYHPSYVLRTESPHAARGRSGASGSANDKVLSDLRRALALIQRS